MTTNAEHQATQVAEQVVAEFYEERAGDLDIDSLDMLEVAKRAAALAVEVQAGKIVTFLEGWPQEFQRKATGIRTLIEGDLT